MKQSLKNEEYIVNMFNDLKIPATAQVCALKSLLSCASSKFPEDETDLIKLTLNSCKYMQKLINTCLCVSKLNFKRLTLKYEYFDIGMLVKEIIKEKEILLKYNRVKIEINSSCNLKVHADKALMEQVIDSVITNSIDNAYKDTVIQINISQKNKEFYFEVKSNSPYINEDIIKNIFNKNNGYLSLYAHPGISLGMILSKDIMNAHFGRMIVRSFEDDINIFGFCLPLR